MKEKPGISADLSLPFPGRGESQRYDSDPETPSKRHRNGTPEHNIFQELHPLPGACPFLQENLGGPLDKRLTMCYTTRVEFNDTRIAATL